ncbi:hypothetical protein J6590_059700 [Homalodisca vitripennis]|nr:hypothetical protein J6590_059700 [Homalodisca vitripennis]
MFNIVSLPINVRFVTRSTEVRIGDGHTTFPCLSDCGSHFSLNLLQNLLEARAFAKLLQRIQLDEVKAAEIEGLEMCPFCEFATIPPPETNIFTCLNPECLRESCRKCHKVSHIPQRCEEVEDDEQTRARKYIEDEMTKALVRECYKCKKSFIKVDGCNKMTCTCGAKMCYICRKPITDYNHFNSPGDTVMPNKGDDGNLLAFQPLMTGRLVLFQHTNSAPSSNTSTRILCLSPSRGKSWNIFAVLNSCE